VRRAAAHRLLSAQYGKVHGGQSPERPEAVFELRPRIPRRRRQHRCHDQPCFDVFGRACEHTGPGPPATKPPARKHTCPADSASGLRCARASQTGGACRAPPSRRRCPRTCSPQGSGRRPDAARSRPGRAQRRIRCRRHPLPARCPPGQARALCQPPAFAVDTPGGGMTHPRRPRGNRMGRCLRSWRIPSRQGGRLDPRPSSPATRGRSAVHGCGAHNKEVSQQSSPAAGRKTVRPVGNDTSTILGCGSA